MKVRGMANCGGCELVGINEAGWSSAKYVKEYMHSFDMDRFDGMGKAFCVISYAWDVGKKTGPRSRGQASARLAAFKQYVEAHSLGVVEITKRSQTNPVHSNNTRSRVAIWYPNNPAVRQHGLGRGWVRKIQPWFLSYG